MDHLAPGGNGNDRYAKVAESVLLCGSNSVVECDLAKVEVAGSNPVSRSIFVSRTTVLVVTDGAVAKW